MQHKTLSVPSPEFVKGQNGSRSRTAQCCAGVHRSSTGEETLARPQVKPFPEYRSSFFKTSPQKTIEEREGKREIYIEKVFTFYSGTPVSALVLPEFVF
jgi:hypothetical protein